MQQGKGQEEGVTDNFENCPLGTVKKPDRVSRQSGPVIAEISDLDGRTDLQLCFKKLFHPPPPRSL